VRPRDPSKDPSEGACTAGEPSPFSLERLSAFADGDLPASELASVRQHVDSCAACARRVEELGAMARAARALEVPEPPATLWPSVAGVLAREDDGVLARDRMLGRWLSLRPFAIGALAGAAAVAALVVVAGARRDAAVARAAAEPAVEPPPAVPLAPAARDPLLAEAEQEFASAAAVYERSIEKLRRLLVREEATWSPEVRARYDERLARLDDAIARSREAARRAPGDSEGNEQLFAAYQQKIAFLAETVHRGGLRAPEGP
jgi:hypothetical protein